MGLINCISENTINIFLNEIKVHSISKNKLKLPVDYGNCSNKISWKMCSIVICSLLVLIISRLFKFSINHGKIIKLILLWFTEEPNNFFNKIMLSPVDVTRLSFYF